ncbi:hypothetical protein AcV7_006157 [Taiwanofungus camphoratus]|nr:hypothetical protein AcV7_006157 [Antrodia cinnamomea]
MIARNLTALVLTCRVPQQPVQGSPSMPRQVSQHSDVPDMPQLYHLPPLVSSAAPRSPIPSSAPLDVVDTPFDAVPTQPTHRLKTSRKKRPRVHEDDTEPQAGPSRPAERRRRRRRLSDGTAVAVATPPHPHSQPVAGPSTESTHSLTQCSWRGCREYVSRDSAWGHFQAVHLGEARDGRITCQHPTCLAKEHNRDMGVGNIKRHYEADLNFRTYTCPLCDAEFKRGDMRPRHVEHHCHVCPHCLEDFGSSAARNEHRGRCQWRPP